MATPADSKVTKLTSDAEPSDDEEGAEAIDQGHASSSTSDKKKKKKRSKAKKILDAFTAKKAVPQAVLEKIVDKVKEDGEPGSETIDAEDVRQVLQQIRIRDILKGKSGIGGNNWKDVGEHKVLFSLLVTNQSPDIVFSFGVHNLCLNWVWTTTFMKFCFMCLSRGCTTRGRWVH